MYEFDVKKDDVSTLLSVLRSPILSRNEVSTVQRDEIPDLTIDKLILEMLEVQGLYTNGNSNVTNEDIVVRSLKTWPAQPPQAFMRA